MAQENEDGQEKTEEATPKRLEEARQKGQVPRSRELTTMSMLLMAAVSMSVLGRHMVEQLGQIMHQSLEIERAKLFDHWAVIDLFGSALGQAGLVISPFLLVMLVTAFAAPIALGGWSFSTEALAFKPDKLNPLQGMKRIFAVRGLVELIKSLAKFMLIGSVGAGLLWHYLPELMGLGRESDRDGAGTHRQHTFEVFHCSECLTAADCRR